jgi:hypothetical protein
MSDGSPSTSLFYGQEVEHTRFYGQRTLFVEGEVDLAWIDATLTQVSRTQGALVTHVYFGARYSTPSLGYLIRTAGMMINWGYVVTLDVPLSTLPDLHQVGFHTFSTPQGVPYATRMCVNVRVPVPYLTEEMTNAERGWRDVLHIKIDQPVRYENGKAKELTPKNEAIMVLSLRDLLRSVPATLWQDYAGDVPLPLLGEARCD